MVFGALDMPSDVRGIGRFLGARSINDVTRHRCGDSDCYFAWIGAVAKADYDSSNVCLYFGNVGHPGMFSFLED